MALALLPPCGDGRVRNIQPFFDDDVGTDGCPRGMVWWLFVFSGVELGIDRRAACRAWHDVGGWGVG